MILDVQLRAHLKSLPKVVRILLQKGNVDGSNINIEILLGLDHIKIDGKLKMVPERAVEKWVLGPPHRDCGDAFPKTPCWSSQSQSSPLACWRISLIAEEVEEHLRMHLLEAVGCSRSHQLAQRCGSILMLHARG